MRIAIHSYVFYPEQFLINELAEELAARGHDIQVFTGLPNYPRGEFFPGYSFLRGPFRETHGRVCVVRYPIVPRKKGFKFLALNYLSHFISGLLNLPRLRRVDLHFIFATSPITTAIPAIIRAKLTGAKVCLWLQDLWPDSVAAVGALGRKSLAYKVIGTVVRWIYRHVDIMMIQSPGFEENLREFGFRGETVVIPNWAPSINYQSQQTPVWLERFPRGSFTVTFAGNIGKAQAIDTILDAAVELQKYSDIKFAIVGDGSDKNIAEVFVRDHKLENVIFFGRQSLEDMPALFRQSSALLVSLSDVPIFAKTIPSKVQAYMAAGKPLLGSLNGVGAKIIDQARAGLVSPALDSKGLAEKILLMKSLSSEAREEMGKNARSYFEQHFLKAKVIDQIEESCSRITSKS